VQCCIKIKLTLIKILVGIAVMLYGSGVIHDQRSN
jgi:hypothetical protein